MEQITKHPLYAAADILKRALIENGFSLYDDGETPEVLPVEKNIPPFAVWEDFAVSPVILEGGKYTLRTSLLTAELTGMRSALPLKKIICGKIYDKKDPSFPARLRIEGVFADNGTSLKEYRTLWNKIAVSAFGVAASTQLEAMGMDSYRIMITKDGSSAGIGCTGPGGWLTKALLGTDGDAASTWAFSVDVDTVALHLFRIENRAALYRNVPDHLTGYVDCSAAVGDTFSNRASDLLRSMGYSQYIGMRLYPPDIYKKMNMIQEAWDANNQAVQLLEPIDGNTGLPTVLTPAAEQALADCFQAGAQGVKLFDIGHIFLPARDGGAPIEKVAISICAYGTDVNSKSFKADVVRFLKQLGIHNHFFFPTNLAIAYDTKDTWLVLDEKMRYLEGNFGGISSKAEENFGIGTHAFMANLELEPLKAKSAEEYAFTPPETL